MARSAGRRRRRHAGRPISRTSSAGCAPSSSGPTGPSGWPPRTPTAAARPGRMTTASSGWVRRGADSTSGGQTRGSVSLRFTPPWSRSRADSPTSSSCRGMGRRVPRPRRPRPRGARPPLPDIERIPGPGEPSQRGGRGRRGAPASRPAHAPRRTIWPQSARRSPAPAPRLAAPVAARPSPVPAPPRPALAAAAAVELEVPGFLARPRSVAPALPAPAPPPRPAAPRPRARRRRRRGGRGGARVGWPAAALVGVTAALVGIGGTGGWGNGARRARPLAGHRPLTRGGVPRRSRPTTWRCTGSSAWRWDIDWRFLAAIGAQESTMAATPGPGA